MTHDAAVDGLASPLVATVVALGLRHGPTPIPGTIDEFPDTLHFLVVPTETLPLGVRAVFGRTSA